MTRAQLLEALSMQMRVVSAQAVMISQTVAQVAEANPTDIECADLLVIYGPMTAGELARKSGLTTGAITGVIDRLERKGWVARERDPNDRRKVIVKLVQSDENFERAARAYGPLIELMNDVVAQFTDDELATILRYFRLSSAAVTDGLPRMRAAASE
jgi:DNA-binding MarR family transcriptional regulator